MGRIDKTVSIIQITGCWMWMGAMSVAGYGRIRWRGVWRAAHRVFYEMYKGPIPEGMQVDHVCKLPACVNPDHLDACSPVENNLRSSSPSARNAKKTACLRGHAFDAANTIITMSHVGNRIHRACRECRRNNDRARRAKRRIKP